MNSSRSHYNTAAAANNTQRFIARKKHHPNDSVGLTLVGGNAVGIFVRDVMPGGLLDGANGLLCGDQILQVSICRSSRSRVAGVSESYVKNDIRYCCCVTAFLGNVTIANCAVKCSVICNCKVIVSAHM